MADFHIYDLLNIDTMISIVDVGAAPNKDEPEPYQFLIDRGVARVTGFEPDQKACEVMNTRYTGSENRCFPYFIGDGSDGTFHHLRQPMSSSLYKPNKPVLDLFTGLKKIFDEVDSEPVSTTRLDNIDDLGDVDFIKLDVQGAELDVLRGGPEVLKNAIFVFTEVEFVEMYVDQPMFADVDQHMRKSGYMFHGLVGVASRAFKPMIVRNNPHDGLNQPIWGDAMYFRDPRLYETTSTEKLLKLALIGHEMIGSYDLTLHILTLLDKRNGSDIASQYLSRF